MMKNNFEVLQRQAPLMQSYVQDPGKAWITDSALIEGKNLSDPWHTSVAINQELKIDFPIGVHRALGGDHDAANPGDILCAALASCFESTLRLIANRLNVQLEKTRVYVSAEVDVRGTLMMDRAVPVGFQKMTANLEITAAQDTKPNLIKTLIRATENSCIIFQTLKKGIPISVESKILTPEGQLL